MTEKTKSISRAEYTMTAWVGRAAFEFQREGEIDIPFVHLFYRALEIAAEEVAGDAPDVVVEATE